MSAFKIVIAYMIHFNEVQFFTTLNSKYYSRNNTFIVNIHVEWQMKLDYLIFLSYYYLHKH